MNSNGNTEGAKHWSRLLNGDGAAMFDLGMETKRMERYDNARYWFAQAHAAGHLMAEREYRALPGGQG